VRAEVRKESLTPRSGNLVATRRDPNGCILAPVKINGQGPFEFIVNTGAGRSVISETLARRLGLCLDSEPPILVHGVTASSRVQTVRVDSMVLGHLRASAVVMPVIANLFGSYSGFLSLADFAIERLLIDMHNNRLLIPRSLAPPGSYPSSATLAMDPAHTQLVVVDTKVDGILVRAMIDTGADVTLGNLALHRALTHQQLAADEQTDIQGATMRSRIGKLQALPAMELGSLRIVGARIAYGNLSLFEHLKWASTPAVLLGMNILGQFESVLLDYMNRMIRFQPRSARRHFEGMRARQQHSRPPGGR
jgi:predicted aspartyl protease